MDATEICPLTREAVAEVLSAQVRDETPSPETGQRKTPRWPFPGTVQMWLTDEHGDEQHLFATCLNLSLNGLGMLCEEPLSPGQELPIAIHQPLASLQGRAIVRHCTANDAGYYIGMEFIFEDA